MRGLRLASLVIALSTLFSWNADTPMSVNIS